MKINFKKLWLKLTSGALLLAPFQVAAQAGLGAPPPINTGTGTVGLIALITNIINWVLGLAALVAVIFLVYGGFKYIISGGDSSQAEAAKNTIVYAIIGLIVIGLSWAIASFVIGTFQAPSG